MMSIEGGVGVGAGAGVGAVSVGPVGSGFEAASNSGAFKSFGPKFESVAYSPIDRVVGKGEIENMTTIRFDQPRIESKIKEETPVEVEILTDGITKNTPVNHGVWDELNPEVVERALRTKAWFEARQKLQVQPQIVPNIIEFQEPEIAPQEAQHQGLSTPRVQTHPIEVRREEQQIKTPQHTSEIWPTKQEKQTGPKEAEDVALEKRRIVRDGKAFYRRLLDGFDAVKKAFSNVEVGKKVSGRDVEIPEEYFEVRSGALKQEGDNKTPDGGYELYRKGVREIGEVATPEEMVQRVQETASENEPVIKVEGDLGEKRVKQETVGKVYIHKSYVPPVEEVNIRISKKEVGISQPQLFEVQSNDRERRIQDDPDLAEVFKLAA